MQLASICPTYAVQLCVVCYTFFLRLYRTLVLDFGQVHHIILNAFYVHRVVMCFYSKWQTVILNFQVAALCFIVNAFFIVCQTGCLRSSLELTLDNEEHYCEFRCYGQQRICGHPFAMKLEP
jgi:hypothetical protein